MSKDNSDIKVSKTNVVSKGILTLLKNTTLGTPGKLRYKQTDVEKTLKSLKELEFIEIQKRSRVLGTAAIVHRTITNQDEKLKALYVRYLSIYSPLKTKNQPQKSKNFKVKSNALRNEIGQLFSSELEKPFHSNSEQGLFYAYVEKDNILSKNLCQSFGFKDKRTVLTLLFSRFTTSKFSSISILEKAQLDPFKSNLKKFYLKHNFVSTDSLGDHGKCFIYTKENEIIGGLRAIPINWEIIEIPGIKGFIMQKILPRLPFFNRIFNPKKLQFLAFDSIWYKNDRLEFITEIMEHACSYFEVNMGMIWGDEESKVITKLQASKKMGFLHKVNGAVKAKLMVRTINMGNEEEKELTNNPVFVSAVDMI